MELLENQVNQEEMAFQGKVELMEFQVSLVKEVKQGSPVKQVHLDLMDNQEMMEPMEEMVTLVSLVGMGTEGSLDNLDNVVQMVVMEKMDFQVETEHREIEVAPDKVVLRVKEDQMGHLDCQVLRVREVMMGDPVLMEIQELQVNQDNAVNLALQV